MHPIITQKTPAKPDIDYPSLFKEGPRVVNKTPQKTHPGEK
jgi:hypothetical protein